MKKSLLFLSLVFFAFSGFSQIAWDWETPETSYGIWTWGVDAPAVVYNPMMTYYNMSDSVIMVTTGESAWGWGVGGSLTEDLYISPGSDSMFTIKILADVASPILFKFENEDNSSSVESWADYVTPGQWQEISIYLPTPASDLTKWIFWFDPMVELGTGITFYLDDVMQMPGNVVMWNDHDNLVIPWEAFWSGENDIFFDTVPNPLVDGINKSGLVGHTVTGADTWDGAYIKTDGIFDFTEDSVFTMDVYSEFAGDVAFKIEDALDNSINIEIWQTYDTPGEWVTMRFAFPDRPAAYGAMVIFFDMGQTNVGQDWYFDNIQGPPIVKKEWGVTVNLSVVDQVGFETMAFDVWWNPGEDWDTDDPNVYLFERVELLDDNADGTWEGSVLVPWTNVTTGTYVTNLYCLFGDDEEIGDDYCDIEFEQAAWDTEFNLVDTVFGEPGAVEDFESGITKLFPNPVDDVLTISNTDDVVGIQVYSVVGQRVMSITNTKSGFMEINVSQLEGGVYFVNLTNRDGTITAHKIIVE